MIQKHMERMEAEEFVARGFVAIGALWWSLAAVMSLIAGNTAVFYVWGAVALVCVGVLVVGWFYERIAAAVLLAAAAAAVAYGISMGWAAGLWIMVGLTLIVEMIAGAAMFFAARHEETVIEHAEQRSQTRLPTRGAHVAG